MPENVLIIIWQQSLISTIEHCFRFERPVFYSVLTESGFHLNDFNTIWTIKPGKGYWFSHSSVHQLRLRLLHHHRPNGKKKRNIKGAKKMVRTWGVHKSGEENGRCKRISSYLLPLLPLSRHLCSCLSSHAFLLAASSCVKSICQRKSLHKLYLPGAFGWPGKVLEHLANFPAQPHSW